MSGLARAGLVSSRSGSCRSVSSRSGSCRYGLKWSGLTRVGMVSSRSGLARVGLVGSCRSVWSR